jgi:hypothetical protein
VLSSYGPSDGNDRILIVIGLVRAGTDLGDTTKTFGASSLAQVVSESASARDVCINDLSLGSGTSTASASITLSYTDTGSDTSIVIALTGHNLVQQTAEASDAKGELSTYNVADNIDAVITGITTGALVVSVCYSHSATGAITIDGSGNQTLAGTAAVTSGNKIQVTVGWSVSTGTSETHRYHVANNGENASWIIAAWEPA